MSWSREISWAGDACRDKEGRTQKPAGSVHTPERARSPAWHRGDLGGPQDAPRLPPAAGSARPATPGCGSGPGDKSLIFVIIYGMSWKRWHKLQPEWVMIPLVNDLLLFLSRYVTESWIRLGYKNALCSRDHLHCAAEGIVVSFYPIPNENDLITTSPFLI